MAKMAGPVVKLPCKAAKTAGRQARRRPGPELGFLREGVVFSQSNSSRSIPRPR